MSRKEDRVFTSKDVWRIYCNNLSITERFKFSRQFKKSKGDCFGEHDPCDEIGDEFEEGKAAIKVYQDSIEVQNKLFNDFSNILGSTFDDINNFAGVISDEIAEFRKSNDEATRSRWDNILEKSIPNIIERERVIDGLQELSDSVAAGAFVKTGKFAEEILRSQGAREGYGLIIDKSEAILSNSTKAAVAFAVLVGGLYKTFVEDC